MPEENPPFQPPFVHGINGEPTSAFDETNIPLESGRGIDAYKSYLGLDDRIFYGLMRGKDVLDLGSGDGNFAAEVERERLSSEKRLPLFRTRWLPKKVDSLNIRYGMPDYAEYRATHGISTLNTRDTNTTANENRALEAKAWERAQEHFLGYDWHNLSAIQDESYDTIISSIGFPYYSDITITDAGQVLLGEKSRGVFQGLGRVLRQHGKMVLLTEIPYEVLQGDTAFQETLKDSLKQQGYNFDIEVTQGASMQSAWHKEERVRGVLTLSKAA